MATPARATLGKEAAQVLLGLCQCFNHLNLFAGGGAESHEGGQSIIEVVFPFFIVVLNVIQIKEIKLDSTDSYLPVFLLSLCSIFSRQSLIFSSQYSYISGYSDSDGPFCFKKVRLFSNVAYASSNFSAL